MSTHPLVWYNKDVVLLMDAPLQPQQTTNHERSTIMRKTVFDFYYKQISARERERRRAEARSVRMAARKEQLDRLAKMPSPEPTEADIERALHKLKAISGPSHRERWEQSLRKATHNAEHPIGSFSSSEHVTTAIVYRPR